MARKVSIVFLGTGGAVPSKERLTSSILVFDWNGHTLLLDAGEGAQLRLMEAGYSPSDIDTILLTHSHGDHVNGVAGLLQSMSVQKRRRPLTILAPPSTASFIRETLEASVERLGFDVVIQEASPRGGSIQLYERGGDSLWTLWFPACHTSESIGFRLEWRLRPRILVDAKASFESILSAAKSVMEREGSTLQLAYTGDTAPCKSVLEASKGVDILIHEATYDDRMESEALERLHSTSRHAAIIAREAGVRMLVLTHVSARYRGYEARRLLQEAREVFPQSLLAYDLMRLEIVAPIQEVPLTRILASREP